MDIHGAGLSAAPSHTAGQSSSRGTVDTFDGREDEDEDEDDEGAYDELGPSQLGDAPLTQPSQTPGPRRRKAPDLYTPGTDAVRGKGKGKTRRK
jgi:hypothetical protein